MKGGGIPLNKFYITKADVHKIPCISSIPDDCRTVIITIHGFCSCKESDSITFFMNYFNPKDIGVVAYDQPGHGECEEPLRVGGCLDSLAAVEQYVRTTYPAAELCYIGSSFGGYILGLYLALRQHAGHKALMRCCAVNFPRMILGAPGSKPDPKALEQMDRQGYILLQMDTGNPVKLPRGFFEDLMHYDLDKLYETRKPTDVTMAFAHGGADQVVNPEAVKAFTRKFGYPLTIFEGENHPICTKKESPAQVAEILFKMIKDKR